MWAAGRSLLLHLYYKLSNIAGIVARLLPWFFNEVGMTPCDITTFNCGCAHIFVLSWLWKISFEGGGGDSIRGDCGLNYPVCNYIILL